MIDPLNSTDFDDELSTEETNSNPENQLPPVEPEDEPAQLGDDGSPSKGSNFWRSVLKGVLISLTVLLIVTVAKLSWDGLWVNAPIPQQPACPFSSVYISA